MRSMTFRLRVEIILLIFEDHNLLVNVPHRVPTLKFVVQVFILNF